MYVCKSRLTEITSDRQTEARNDGQKDRIMERKVRAASHSDRKTVRHKHAKYVCFERILMTIVILLQ